MQQPDQSYPASQQFLDTNSGYGMPGTAPNALYPQQGQAQTLTLTAASQQRTGAAGMQFSSTFTYAMTLASISDSAASLAAACSQQTCSATGCIKVDRLHEHLLPTLIGLCCTLWGASHMHIAELSTELVFQEGFTPLQMPRTVRRDTSPCLTGLASTYTQQHRICELWCF